MEKFGASNRLRKDSQIKRVLEKGILLRGQNVLVRQLPSEQVYPPLEGKGPFLAIVISRKKEKNAVRRNRMKRQIREIFRKEKQRFLTKTAYVVIARQVLKKTTYREIEKDFFENIFKNRN